VKKVGTRSCFSLCEFVSVKRILLVLASDVLETENSFRMFGLYGTSTSDGDTTLPLCYRASYHITVTITVPLDCSCSEDFATRLSFSASP